MFVISPASGLPHGKLGTAAGLALVRGVAASGNLVGLTITEFALAYQPGADDGTRFIRELCEAASPLPDH